MHRAVGPSARDASFEIWPLGKDPESILDRLTRIWNVIVKRDKEDLSTGIQQGLDLGEWYNTHCNAGYDMNRQSRRNSRHVKPVDKMQIIHMAVQYKWVEGVEIIVYAGADVNTRDFRSSSGVYPYNTSLTPLMYACDDGRLPLVRLLVDQGANIHYVDPETKRSPMSLALAYFSFPIISVLRQHGGTICKDHVKDVSLMDTIQAFNDPTMKVPRASQRPDELEEKVEDVKQISLTIMRLMFETGSDPNEIQGEGMPAIHTCIQGFNGDLRCLQLMVAQGADIQTPYEASYTYNYTMLTPLFAAALNKNGLKAMHWLIQQGAEVEGTFQPRYRAQLIGGPSSMLWNLLEEDMLEKRALALIKAGCKVSEKTVAKIRELKLATESRQVAYIGEVGATHPLMEEAILVLNEMLEFVSQAKSLQWSVRTALRLTYGIASSGTIQQLPLPSALKKYMMCMDL